MRTIMRAPLVTALAAVVGLLLLGATPAPSVPDTSGVAADALPAMARESLPLITELSATQCPELPPVWIVAQIQAESGWDPGLTADLAGGAAGLYQLSARNWQAAGGPGWPSDPPDSRADVLSAEAHLRIAVPWVCANLRAAGTHLEATGKTADPLDAMLVCHIAGCGRVTGSATGIPAAGEAGCGERCARIVGRYIAAVRGNVERYSAPVPPPAPPPPAPEPPPPPPAEAPPPPAPEPPAPPAAPAAWTGGATGCEQADPTGDGCLTGATRHGFDLVTATFGGWSGGPVIRNAGCWDKHAWNPRSDHPRGRACDLFATGPGVFAEGGELESGWNVANWFRANADPLKVKYLIWQGRYWDPGVADQDGGWGRRYTGGGVYDTRNATGGHFDHVHVSFRE